MKRNSTILFGVIISSAAGGALGSGPAHDAAVRRFEKQAPWAHLRYDQDRARITQVWGKAFSSGATPEEAAASFVERHAGLFGVRPDELWDNGVQSVARDAFRAFYYRQTHEGIPVDCAGLTVLVRLAENGVVLVNGDLYPVRDDLLIQPDVDAFQASVVVQHAYPHLESISEPELVIFPLLAEPILAWKMTASTADRQNYENWLVYLDARSGQIAAQYDGRLNIDVSGNVTGKATPGLKPDQGNNPAVSRPIGDAHVTNEANGAETYTADNGNYTVSNPGSSPVTITVDLDGRVIEVLNAAGAELSVSQTVTPPGPGNFALNDAPTEFVTAQVNALVRLHEVNELMLSVNDAYPITEKRRANVNLASSCNAYYDINSDQSTNYYRAGSGCPNMAYSSVCYHEYGHHIVEKGHDNAWPAYPDYHEGMADAASAMTANNSCIGEDFFGPNTGCLRNGDTANRQYPCGGGGHFCGEVISGCTWHTLEALNDAGFDGLGITRDLWLNSILLHPPGIQPGIAVDFATLDDDDGDLDNGSPHYAQIDAGFSAHNMGLPDFDIRCPDVAKFTGACKSGGKLVGKVIFSDESHNAESVTMRLGSTTVVATVEGRKAKGKTCCVGPGLQFLKLLDPANCKPDKLVNCN